MVAIFNLLDLPKWPEVKPLTSLRFDRETDPRQRPDEQETHG